MRTYNEKAKVDELIEHEERIRDAFEDYAIRANGNLSRMKDSSDIIRFMLREQLLPPHTGDEKEDIRYWSDNGFGKELTVEYTGGAWINISSEISKTYARKYYLASNPKSAPSFENGKKAGHRYMLSHECAIAIAKANPSQLDVPQFKQPFAGQEWKDEFNNTTQKGTLGMIVNPTQPKAPSSWESNPTGETKWH